jgi:hypothetical protein
MEVHDLTLGTEVTAEGVVHGITVYFHPVEVREDTQLRLMPEQT